ncbi:uncharacterized protein LOC105795745 [Gossypium raimondii]|uniref:uncharacterized protein LOC105795745 n=1 Tax=Gossypium raimondii TaxID=29730 RepID=UPI00063B08D8|nr:uncharacterized protein LOC105795745 [Gossypium raimondii]
MKKCNAFLQNKLPSKLKDLESFTIPCNIRESYCGKALCNLGANINLMPKSIFKLLGIGEVRPTIMTLQLADRSFAYPKGKIEDVLVRVDRSIFPADFIVLDFEVDKEVPIILGRPFLATGRTLIDVQKGELIMRVQENQVTFNVLKAMKFPCPTKECLVIEELEALVSMESNFEEDPSENTLGSEPLEDEKCMKVPKYLLTKKDAKPRLNRWILLLQEFDLKIQDRKCVGNQVADHLSRLEQNEVTSSLVPINENFPNEHIFEDQFLFKQCADNIIRKCVAESEIDEILYHYHSSLSGGHFCGSSTAVKILQTGFFWPTVFKDMWLKWLLDKYDVKHKIAAAYHPQSNGQVGRVN